jgi:hypothetical protein
MRPRSLRARTEEVRARNERGLRRRVTGVSRRCHGFRSIFDQSSISARGSGRDPRAAAREPAPARAGAARSAHAHRCERDRRRGRDAVRGPRRRRRRQRRERGGEDAWARHDCRSAPQVSVPTGVYSQRRGINRPGLIRGRPGRALFAPGPQRLPGRGSSKGLRPSRERGRPGRRGAGT